MCNGAAEFSPGVAERCNLAAAAQDITSVTRGLYKGAKTGLRIGWQKAGKPAESLFVHMPFRNEAADLVTSLGSKVGVDTCVTVPSDGPPVGSVLYSWLMRNTCMGSESSGSLSCSLPERAMREGALPLDSHQMSCLAGGWRRAMSAGSYPLRRQGR